MLGIEVDELRRRQEATATGDVLSLNALVQTDEHTTIERIDTLHSTERDGDPEEATSREMAKERFRQAFALLPEREREVAALLYVKNLTLREIGHVLGVTESRVCQIHAETREKLRRMLADDALLFSAVA
jgi:RNA polymerase sigma factor for flagellar operon FliA